MSIKTLRKRIALVAVSALGVGLLSVAPAKAATSVDAITGAYCALYDSNNAVTSTATSVASMVIPQGGVFGISLDDADDNRVTVAAPGLITAVTAGTGNSVDADGLGASVTAAATDVISITANSVGTFKVRTATANAPGTIVDTITVTVVASCATATWSDSKSKWAINTAARTTFGDLEKEADSVYTFVDEGTAIISILGRNAYDADLPVGTWVASATNGAVVGIGLTVAASAVGVTPSASLSTDGSQSDNSIGSDSGTDVDPGLLVQVEQGTSGTALNTVVTITYNGTKVIEKNLLFTGDLATLTVSGVDVQLAGGATKTDLFEVAAKDAAGNLLSQIAVTGELSKLNSLVTAVTAGYTSNDGSGNVDVDANDASPDGDGAIWTCAAKTGTTPMRLQATNNAGTVIYSNEFTAACGSTPSTYTASLDKAVYAPGDIATLTITAKDATGAVVAKGSDVESGGGAPDVAGANLTAISTPAAGDVFDAAGKKTYTFTVGSTEGKFNMQVSLGYTGNTAVAVPYEIKATTSSVTNAEVLAAIVKLIASINKQIKALQKSLRR